MSFTNGNLPITLKQIVVRPQLRKLALLINILSRYHPLLNLPLLKKIIENAMAQQP